MRGTAVAAGLLALCCATTPKPTVLSQADAVHEGAASRQAARLAPQAHQHANRLLLRAKAAYDDDDVAGSQILGEHAIAAYGHAAVLARIVEAQKRLRTARKNLAAARSELASIDERQKRLAAEADSLELRIKVARDALPLVPNGPATPERERARRAAARAMTTQARLLCVATRMLAPRSPLAAETSKRLDELDRTLAAKPEVTPIDAAIEARSSCLRALTLARRPAGAAAPAAGAADRLLDGLSRAGLEPIRDDRGVVVTLRGALARRRLTADGAKKLATLGRVAKAHADFPVLVVFHSPRGKTAATKAVVDALRESGAASIRTHDARSSLPVVDSSRRSAASRNTRIEVVFVAPAS